MGKKLKIISLIVGSLLAIVTLAGAAYLNLKGNIEAEYQKQFDEVVSIASFRQQFGATPVIQGKQVIEKVDVIYWTDNETIHAALYVGGIWLEVPRQFVNVQGK